MKRFLSNVVLWSAKQQMGNEVRSLGKSVRPQVEYLEAREVLSGPDWFSKYLPDAAVASLARSDYAVHGAINYHDMLGIYSQIATDGRVDASEFASLQSLAQNASVLHMPDHVSFLSTQVIDTDNPANASIQGMPLPDLGPGSPAWTLQLLVGKWFLGVDHPRVEGEGLTYSTVRGTLFGSDGPSFNDVAQGEEGDCWLMASLATLAAHDSSVIEDMFIYNGGAGNGIDIWTVRFFEAGSPVYVTVDNRLPTKDGSIFYARPQDGVLWVALAEKAYAQLNEFVPNITRFPGHNAYAALDQGSGNQVIKTFSTLTSQDATGELPGTWSQILAGRPAVLLTGDSPSSPYLLNHHFYAAIDYDPWTGTFTLFDPYGIESSHADGRYGLFWADATFLNENFLYDVAAFAGWTEPTESLQALAAAPELSEGLPTGNDSRSFISASGAGKTVVAPPLLADAGFAKSNTQMPWDAVESVVHARSQDGQDQDVQAADFARRVDSLFAAVG